uniref:Vacuolar ATPase assembly protein VMA22 n=1 Tax=Palpitomonas bilix TaxID=652834 RepID=A0A7S3G3F1_9EUKA|mmetsp:Transcript_2280/g.4701  ORF Transcript_2280/g.4701 Transcript_2280/m.4701 type:complete len:182 (+) Transcript_2280:49-594(+)
MPSKKKGGNDRKSTLDTKKDVAKEGKEATENDDLAQKKADFFFLFFDSLDQFCEKRKELDSLLKDAFFNLLEVRKSLGAAEVTPLKFNLNKMQPLLSFHADEAHDEETGVSYLEFSSAPTEAAKDKALDPTKWYGLLPPPALRQAQAKFRQALQICLELATHQSKMSVAESHYSELAKVEE